MRRVLFLSPLAVLAAALPAQAFDRPLLRPRAVWVAPVVPAPVIVQPEAPAAVYRPALAAPRLYLWQPGPVLVQPLWQQPAAPPMTFAPQSSEPGPVPFGAQASRAAADDRAELLRHLTAQVEYLTRAVELQTAAIERWSRSKTAAPK